MLRAKIDAMRRIQAATLILALLAAPLALMARGYAGAAQECAMACCHGRHAAAVKMNMCQHSSKGAATCTIGCESHSMDYGLNCPLPPFQPTARMRLPELTPARPMVAAMALRNSAGYFPPPFNPPRA